VARTCVALMLRRSSRCLSLAVRLILCRKYTLFEARRVMLQRFEAGRLLVHFDFFAEHRLRMTMPGYFSSRLLSSYNHCPPRFVVPNRHIY